MTERIKPPRAVFLPFMMGHHFGVPFHRELQRRIILDALALVYSATESGSVQKLPISWAQARNQAKALGLTEERNG